MKKEYEFHIEVTLGNSIPYFTEMVKIFILNDSFPTEFEIKSRLYDYLKVNSIIWYPSEVKSFQVCRVFENMPKGECKKINLSANDDKIIDLELKILDLEEQIDDLEARLSETEENLQKKKNILKALQSINNTLEDFILKNNLKSPIITF